MASICLRSSSPQPHLDRSQVFFEVLDPLGPGIGTMSSPCASTHASAS